MIILLIVYSLGLAWLAGWMLMLLKASGDRWRYRLQHKPYSAPDISDPRWTRNRRILTAGIAAVLLFSVWRTFWVPEEAKTFVSPNRQYALTISFYPDMVVMEDYRVKIVLRDKRTGETLGQVKHNTRALFVTAWGPSIDWEDCVRVEWDQREDARDKVRVVYPERNTAILLPSETWVFPLDELEPLNDPTPPTGLPSGRAGPPASEAGRRSPCGCGSPPVFCLSILPAVQSEGC